MPRVPVELQDMILDYLHADIPTLRTCARVCKSWLPRTRTHLFRTITLHGSAPATLLLFALKDEPLLAHYVQRLTLTGAHDWPTLLKLLRRLPALAHLHARALPEGASPHDERWADEFLALVLALRRLRTLDLRPRARIAAGAVPNARALLAGATGLAQLEHLHVAPVLGRDVAALFAQAVAEAKWTAGDAVPLRYLGCALGVADGKDGCQAVEAFNALLEGAGYGVQHLVLFFRDLVYANGAEYHAHMRGTMKRLRLSPLAQLREIELVFGIRNSFTATLSSETFSFAASVLEALPREALLAKMVLTIHSEVTIFGPVQDWATHRADAWNKLDIEICRLPRIKKVTVRSFRGRWVGEAETDAVTAALAKELSQTRAKKEIDFDLIPQSREDAFM